VAAYENRLGGSTISLNEILETPERIIMLVRQNILENDLSGKLPNESRLLYGMWSGYRKSPEWGTTEQMLGSAGCEVIECHASGHGHENDLLCFIEDLNPFHIRPVHTERMDALISRFGKKCATQSDFLVDRRESL
jgi:hypothetical protein